MKKIIWCSRHPMTEDQLTDLKTVDAMGCDITSEFVLAEGESFPVVETENLIWAGTENWWEDLSANFATWERLLEWDKTSRVQERLVLGVFPPVALEALSAWRRAHPDTDEVVVMTPVSAQTAETRADGTKAVEFSHVRWAYL